LVRAKLEVAANLAHEEKLSAMIIEE